MSDLDPRRIPASRTAIDTGIGSVADPGNIHHTGPCKHETGRKSCDSAGRGAWSSAGTGVTRVRGGSALDLRDPKGLIRL